MAAALHLTNGADLTAGLGLLLEKAKKWLHQLRKLCDQVSQDGARVNELQAYSNAAEIERALLEKATQMRRDLNPSPQPNEVTKSIAVTVIIEP